MNRFEGKTAIVTGASSGIGRGIALRLAEEGANIVVADIKSEPAVEGKPTHEKIQEQRGDAVFIETDVSDESSVKDMVYQAAETYGSIEVLVNNAGVHHSKPVTEEEEEGWRNIIDVNLNGVYRCSKHVIHHMRQEGIEGAIVNIASIAGIVGFGGSAAYCASKGGVVQLTKEMALDYSSESINVNSVSPGVIRTAMTEDMLQDEDTRSFMEQNTVVPRLGKPSDIAAAVAYMASDEASFVTGENLVVDGGWTAK